MVAYERLQQRASQYLLCGCSFLQIFSSKLLCSKLLPNLFLNYLNNIVVMSEEAKDVEMSDAPAVRRFFFVAVCVCARTLSFW